MSIIVIILIILILGLCSTNLNFRSMSQHVMFGLLSLVYLIQHDDLQLHPLSCKLYSFIFLYGWVIFHFLYLFITSASTVWYVKLLW
jgi:hypothetical protein